MRGGRVGVLVRVSLVLVVVVSACLIVQNGWMMTDLLRRQHPPPRQHTGYDEVDAYLDALRNAARRTAHPTLGATAAAGVPRALASLSFDPTSRPTTPEVAHYLLREIPNFVLKKKRKHEIPDGEEWWGVVFPTTVAAADDTAECTLPPNPGGYPAGNRMLHAHKKKRKDEHTPIEYSERMVALEKDGVVGPGFHVSIMDGTELPGSVNEEPILDTHGGKYNVYSHWGDRKLWNDLRWVKNATPGNPAVHKHRGLPVVMPEQPFLWAAKIPNAWVVDGNVYTCTHAFTTGACLWEMNRVKKEAKRFDKVLAICDPWCRGYFHFTHEHLPRIASVYSVLKADPSIVITVPTNRGFVTSFMTDVLGFEKSRLVGTGPVFAPVVYYPQPQTCGNIWTHTLMLLRLIVFSRHGLEHSLFLDHGTTYNNSDHVADPDAKFRVVLAERAGGKSGKSRMPKNYEEVKGRLIEAFPNVVFESSLNKTVLEQVKLFNRAHMVIGPHGANLANIMWCRHGASVVEFMSYKYGNLCYYVTAQRMDLTFRFVMQPSNKGGAYDVSFEELKKHIDDAMMRYRGKPGLSFS